jgi:hypothetical protein
LAAIAEGRLRRGYSKTLAKLDGKEARDVDGPTIEGRWTRLARAKEGEDEQHIGQREVAALEA